MGDLLSYIQRQNASNKDGYLAGQMISLRRMCLLQPIPSNNNFELRTFAGTASLVPRKKKVCHDLRMAENLLWLWNLSIYTVIYTSTLLSHFDQGSPTFHWPPWHSFHPGWSARNPCHLKASRKDHRTTNLHQPHEVETLWPRALDTINSLTWLVNILFRIASNIWPQTSHHQVMKIYLQDFISQDVKWWRSDSTCA